MGRAFCDEPHATDHAAAASPQPLQHPDVEVAPSEDGDGDGDDDADFESDVMSLLNRELDDDDDFIDDVFDEHVAAAREGPAEDDEMQLQIEAELATGSNSTRGFRKSKRGFNGSSGGRRRSATSRPRRHAAMFDLDGFDKLSDEMELDDDDATTRGRGRPGRRGGGGAMGR